MNRRRFLAGTLGAGLLGGLARFGWVRAARPAPPEGPLSAEALALIDAAYSGLDSARILDCHVHMLGFGAGGTGCYVNARAQSPLGHPVQYARLSIYLRASGIEHHRRADQEYLERL